MLDGVVVPDTGQGYDHECCAAHEVETEEEEVALVVQADAVVDPGTVVVHHEDTLVADAAMMRTHGLNVVALVALFSPKLVQLTHCFVPITKQPLYI